MNPILMDVLPFVREGYCCSQLLVLLMLRARGEENPALVRSQQALCHGMGQSEGPCGLLPGGACALSILAGKGAQDEEPHPMLTPIVNEYAAWFYERTGQYGGYACPQVADGLGAGADGNGVRDPVACGELLAECWEKICELVESYGLDVNAHLG